MLHQSVDVSWPQGNYHPGAEEGVFVAATSGDGGTLFTQATFVEDVANARAAGKALGFYHFNGAQDAPASADAFYTAIAPYWRPGDLAALDIESYNGGKAPAQSVAWAMAFANRLAQRFNVSVAALGLGIYGNRSTMSAPGWGALEKAGCWLWLAAPGGYPENTPCGEWSHWTVLQYDSAGNLDRDESESTFAQIAQTLGATLTPEEHNMLTQVYNALFPGGPSMPDGHAGIATSLAQIHAELNSIVAATFTGGTSMKDGGKSISQSLADVAAALKALPANTVALSDTQAAALAQAVAADVAAKLPPQPTSADVAAALQTALAAIPAGVVAAEAKALSQG
jgi:hypothetical protein